jgi:hypothetical protein
MRRCDSFDQFSSRDRTLLELDGQPRDLQLEVVDQPEDDVDGAPSRIWDLQVVEQVAARRLTAPAEAGHGVRAAGAPRGSGRRVPTSVELPRHKSRCANGSTARTGRDQPTTWWRRRDEY